MQNTSMNCTKKSIWFPVTHFKANKLFDEFRLHVLKHTSTEEGESSFVPSFFGSQFGVLQILALFPLLKFKCCLFVVFFKRNICKKKKKTAFFLMSIVMMVNYLQIFTVRWAGFIRLFGLSTVKAFEQKDNICVFCVMWVTVG